MGTRGVVELSMGVPRPLLERLVPAAYDASRDGRVVFALNGLPIPAVDRMLDRPVQVSGTKVPGVLFVTVKQQRDEFLRLAAEAEFVVVGSPELSASLASRGIPHMALLEGLQYLESLPARPVGRPPSGVHGRGPSHR